MRFKVTALSTKECSVAKDKKFKIEDYLAPWELDKDGKKLDEPAEIDPDRLKKYIVGLLNDKEELQERVSDKDAELATVKEQLTTIQREHEDEDQRRKREETEREARYAKLEAEAQERKKVEAIEEAFAEQGITAARARKLAKRVTSTDERDWVKDAEELVEDGFRITDTKAANTDDQVVEEVETLESQPRVVRSSGKPPTTLPASKKKTIDEELDELIPLRGW